MSKWSQFISPVSGTRKSIGLLLLSVLVVTVANAQLRERTGLKSPVLRLRKANQDKATEASSDGSVPGDQLVPVPYSRDNTTKTESSATMPTPAIATSTGVPNPPTTDSKPAADTPTTNPPAGQTPVQTATPQPARETAPISVASAAAATPSDRLNTADPKAEPTPQETMTRAIDDAEAALNYMKANIRDYTCNFSKRERVNGELVPREVASMKLRNRVVQNGKVVIPLSVYLKFNSPSNVKGREVLFVEGRDKDKILCKEGGTRGRFLPAVWLNQTSSFIMSTNRYPISQIGMTRLGERLIENGRESPVDDCKVSYIQGAKVANRPCSYLEVIRPTPRPGLPVGHNNVFCAQIYIDSELKMPVRFAAYDWPATKGGKPRLIEEYMYYNIKVNTGLTDADFSRKNKAYNF